MSLEKHL